MALASDQKIRLNGAAFKHQDLIERCLKGTPNIKLDLQRLNTLASLGLPRRVPCVEAEDNISEDTDGKKVSPCLQEEFTGKNQSSISPRNGLASIDSAEVRKRKADRDVSNSRERVQPKQVEGRFNPHLRANLDLPAELKNRKAIEQAKELFNIQDKENINPRNDLRRRDLRKQATDRSAEKRRLQVSSKLQNAQTGRKVGSLLVKHSIGRAKPSARPPVPSQDREKQVSQQASLDFMVSSKTEDPMNQIGQAKLSVLDAGHPPLLSQDREKQVSHQANLDFMVSSKPEDPMNHTGQAKLSVLDAEHPPLLSQDSEKQVSQQSSLDLMGSLKTGDPVNIMQLSPVRMASPMQHTGNDDRSNSSDSMSISQPLQFNSRGVQVQYKEVAQSTSSLVDGSHRAVMAASVSDLSSSMSTLAISDSNCPEFMHLPPVPEKVELKEEMGNAYRPSILDAKQSASIAQVGAASAACPILPALSAHFVSTSACSITMRTTSAPLATSVSSSQQSIAGNCELSRKSIPSLNNLQPPSKHVPSPASEALMSSQANPVLPTSSTDQGNAFLKEEERQCSAKTGHSANGVLKTGQDRASPEEVALSEAGPAKLISHLHAKNVPDRKATNGIDPNVQQRKQIENDHFVWVNGKRYQKLKKIGRGGSSEVYKVVDRDCNIYALKRIKLKGRDYGTACGFYQEIEYLNKLRDKAYIIRLIDHEVTDKTLFCDDVDRSQIIRDDICIYMVLEYGEIDLANMLEDKFKERSQGINDLDETWLRFYWRQILEAVNTIHEERIVHSDLKPANFLLAKGVLKLIDFGIAKSIQSDTTNIERDAQVGTLNYMSPEAFLMNERDEHGNIIKCGRPSDIWSLGCILYQMVYGKTPFAHITKLHAKIQEVANPNHKINYPPLANPHLLDIMKKCLAWRREDRLKIPQLLNHPFLQPHLANHDCREDIKKGITIQIPEEYSQDPELKMLTEQLVKRLTLLRHMRTLSEICSTKPSLTWGAEPPL